MSTTPVEIRHLSFGRSFRGYRRDAVDEELERIAASFEEVWRDRGELSDQVERLETEIAKLREQEELLKNTLLAAERSAEQARGLAREQADLVIAEAHAEARSITRAAQAERERLAAESRRIRALLEGALDLVHETQTADPGDESDAPEPARSWPRREDTAEFKAPREPLPADERERRSA